MSGLAFQEAVEHLVGRDLLVSENIRPNIFGGMSSKHQYFITTLGAPGGLTAHGEGSVVDIALKVGWNPSAAAQEAMDGVRDLLDKMLGGGR